MEKKEEILTSLSIGKFDVHFVATPSSSADTLVVPQYRKGISLTGVSENLIHGKTSRCFNKHADFLQKNRYLPLGEIRLDECKHRNLYYLVFMSVLDCTEKNAEKTLKKALTKALQAADEKNVWTLAIPKFKIAKFPPKKMASIIKEVLTAAAPMQHLRKIMLPQDYAKYFFS